MTLSHLHANEPGSILRRARTTLGISSAQLVQALARLGDPISPELYERYESDAEASESMPASRWYFLCRALCLNSDVIVEGYSPDLHRSSVLYALKSGNCPLELGPEVQASLQRDAREMDVGHAKA